MQYSKHCNNSQTGLNCISSKTLVDNKCNQCILISNLKYKLNILKDFSVIKVVGKYGKLLWCFVVEQRKRKMKVENHYTTALHIHQVQGPPEYWVSVGVVYSTYKQALAHWQEKFFMPEEGDLVGKTARELHYKRNVK